MKRNKKVLIIGILLSVVFLMTAAYAAFAANLEVEGNIKISSDWDVHIDSITPRTPVGAADSSTPIVNGLSATFTNNVRMPGDSITYDVVVINNGTIDAKLTSCELTINNSQTIACTATDDGPINYSINGLTVNSTTIAGKTSSNAAAKTITFQVTAAYNSSVTQQPDSADLSQVTKLTLVFSQN